MDAEGKQKGADMAAKTMTATELAVELATDPRTVRKFLRSPQGTGKVGKGHRHEIKAGQLKSLRTRFAKWEASREAEAKAKAEAATTDAKDDAKAAKPKAEPKAKKAKAEKPAPEVADAPQIEAPAEAEITA